MSFRFKPCLLVMLSLSMLVTEAWAQVLPDAGSLRQQLEQQSTPNLPKATPLPAATPPRELRPQTGVLVFVKGFQIEGNTLLETASLLAAVSEFTNRELDFAGLQRAADAVAAVYREAGWIVRVYLPEQDVGDGLITLQIIEARFSGTRIEGELPSRVGPDVIEGYFTADQPVGGYLNANKLDRALLLADDLPGVQVAGTLVPGIADGETALALQTRDEALMQGSISIDNMGSRSTGSNRLIANIAANSPAGWGEQLNLNLLQTEGMDYVRAALTMPVGYTGLRMGTNASYLSYEVVEGPGSESFIDLRGHSRSFGLDLSYPLLRERASNLYLLANVDNKAFLNRDTLVRSDYATDSARLGLYGSSFDDFAGGGSNSIFIQGVLGQLSDIKVHPLQGELARDYRKLDFSVSRLQRVTDFHSVFASVQGQYASRGLDSSEKFYIGGAQTIRAYPASEQGGDRGHVLTLEWRWRVAPGWQLSPFIDYGRVTSLPVLPTDNRNSNTLKGGGLSATWQGLNGLSISPTWARRIGSNPQPTFTGADNDGTRKIDRFWLSASMPF